MRILLVLIACMLASYAACADEAPPTFPEDYQRSFAHSDQIACGADAAVKVYRIASIDRSVVEVWNTKDNVIIMITMRDPDFEGAVIARFPAAEITEPMRFHDSIIDKLQLADWALDAFRDSLGISLPKARLLGESCKEIAKKEAARLAGKILDDISKDTD